MLKRLETLVSADFPEYEVDIKRPDASAWGAFQSSVRDSNILEGMLNLLIACGTIRVVDVSGAKAPTFGELVDEWSTLPDTALGLAGLLAGTWQDGVNATRLDLPAILAAAEEYAVLNLAPTAHVARIAELMPLVKLAEECGRFGMTADIMRATILTNRRRGSYSAILVPDIGAFVFERPKFHTWMAHERGSKRDSFGAGVELANSCTAFPERGAVAGIIGDFPGFASSAAQEIRALREDIRVEVRKEGTASSAPAGTPSLPQTP